MISTIFSTNRIFILIYAALLIIIGSLQTNIFDIKLQNVTICVSIIYLLQLWNELSNISITKWRYLIVYILIMISFLFVIFPFHLGNPYAVFNYTFLRALLLISIPIFLLWSQGNEVRQQRLLYLMPMFLLIFFNAYFVIFDFTAEISFDRARHCSNVFALYDIIMGQDGSKLLLSLTYYDFYQPLVYLVSVPFLLVFGKSYTAATLSLPFFWLPLGYISIFKFFNKITRINAAYASVFSFAIIGSVIATSLAKQLMLDFPALCMVCFYNYRLAKSGFLKNTSQSFYVGLIFGLGTLTKSNFLILAVVPLLFSIIRLMFKCFKNRFTFKNLFFNILTHVVGMFLGGGFWYLINNDHYSYVLDYVLIVNGQNEGDPNPMSVQSFLWYPLQFIYYFTPLIFAIITLGFFISLRNFKNHKTLKIMAYMSIFLAYVIGTITWNKDARTLLPAIFYFYPAVIGITYIRNKIIKNTLIGIILSITILLNVSFVNDNKLIIANFITTGPYTLQWKPSHPKTFNNMETYFVYNKLYKQSFGDITPPKLHFENLNDSYTNSLYKSQFPIEYKQTLLDTAGNTILFFRNNTWPDYYLFKLKSINGNLSIQKIGEHKNIGGDIKIYIKEGYLGVRDTFLNNLGNEMIIPIDKDAKTITLAMTEFHAWPSSSIMKLLVKVRGDTQYSWADIPLVCLTNNNQTFSIKNR